MADTLVGFIEPGNVRTEFMDSLIGLLGHDAAGPRRILGRSRVRLTYAYLFMARNELIRGFLDGTDLPWLLQFDNDLEFSEDCLDQLLATADRHQAPVVSGLYMILRPDSLTEAVVVGEAEQPQVPCFRAAGEWTPGGVVDAEWAGAGFLLIHRQVLEHMRAVWPGPVPWFYHDLAAAGPAGCGDYDLTGSDLVLGEDLTFCRRVKHLGYPILVDTAVTSPNPKDPPQQWRPGDPHTGAFPIPRVRSHAEGAPNPMAIFISTDALFIINAVDLSDHVTELSLDLKGDKQITTAMGTNGWESSLQGIKSGEIKITLNGDFAASSVDATLWAAFTAGANVSFDVRPVKTGGRSATNPSYTGSLLMAEYQPITGQVGQLNKTTITLPTSGAVARATA